MTLHPLLAVLLTPNKQALQFATRGVITMAVVLYLALFMNLDNPYWALISAVFLQIRPESGMVIEKGLCQVFGTFVGGGVGVAILALLTPYPTLAIASLTIWIGLNAAAAALVRRRNIVYGFAIAAITATLVVALTMADPAVADSQKVFQIASSRMSEIALGAICATVISMLLWQTQVKYVLMAHARQAIDQLLEYMQQELDPDSESAHRHANADAILQTVSALNDDSSAVVFEGPDGAGRARAASLLCQKVLSLMAAIQILGRLRRDHPELIGAEFDAVVEHCRTVFERLRAATAEESVQNQLQELRRELQTYTLDADAMRPIQMRLLQTVRDLVADLIMVHRANRAIEHSDRMLLKAPGLRPYPDLLLAAITGLRTSVIFIIGAGIWIGTGSPAAVLLMITPVIFAIMLTGSPAPWDFLQKLMAGALVAVPVVLFFALALLARATGTFELLVLVIATPFFFGLLALTNFDTLPYGLGFCIPYVMLLQPGNQMTFAVDTVLSNALSIIVGISIVYWVFKLISTPGVIVMQRRLIRATARDLERLWDPQHEDTEHWFNARMADRLMQLVSYDRARSEVHRNLTALGLTGLNLGHVSMRLLRQLNSECDATLDALIRSWLRALGEAYQNASRGQKSDHFRQASAQLLAALRNSQAIDQDRVELIEGSAERFALTFERIARDFSNEAAKGVVGDNAISSA